MLFIKRRVFSSETTEQYVFNEDIFFELQKGHTAFSMIIPSFVEKQ